MLRIRTKYNAVGTTDYFLGSDTLSNDEKEGVWLGEGARLLGIEGTPVTAQDMDCMLSGFTSNGTALAQHFREDRRSGFDAVLSSSKEFSIAGLCLGQDLATPFRNAVREASAATLRFAERLVGHRGRPESGNLIAANFIHHSSRHNDPHLHSHLVIVNATFDAVKRRWHALDPAPIYRNCKAINDHYQQALSRSLIAQGIHVAIRDGLPHITGVARKTRDALSKAHTMIKAKARELRHKRRTLPGIRVMNQQGWENYINDRFRPPKQPTPSFDRALDPKERASIRNELLRKPSRPVPPPPSDSHLQNHILRDLRRQGRHHTVKSVTTATMRGIASVLGTTTDQAFRSLDNLLRHRNSIGLHPIAAPKPGSRTTTPSDAQQRKRYRTWARLAGKPAIGAPPSHSPAHRSQSPPPPPPKAPVMRLGEQAIAAIKCAPRRPGSRSGGRGIRPG